MRIGVRIGPLWLSERVPWPPGPPSLTLLAVLVLLAYFFSR